ncbi:MAG: B12-binding domain-containing radical SAM protein [Bacillota bacterium]
MKTLIIALNSKYVHASLSPWYLKASCGGECGEIKVMEFTINDNPDTVLSRIYLESCNVAAFSCYIWNIETVLKIAENLKKISPGIRIVLGGPEVSFDAEGVLTSNPSIDFILNGEGEVSFKLLLKSFDDGSISLDSIEGLSYRDDGRIAASSKFALVRELDSIPTPYTRAMLESLKDRIVYFESSRGCPFSCSYCISSTFHGIRYFSMDRVKADLKVLLSEGVKLVKFVDRTFNCNRERAKEIFTFIIENAKETKFHFEAAADLFDDEMISILSKAPAGLIQFEMGIQSTNERTLEAINRKAGMDRVYHYVKRIKALGNIHIHLDLIAGLPWEDYSSFENSFNEVYRLAPHQLQLGFLKMLKGSGIREEYDKYDYKFREYPPYEVLSNRFLNFGEIIELKKIEELVDRYYNSGRFSKSLKYIVVNFFSSPFEFYKDFSRFYENMGYFERSISSRGLYSILFEFASNPKFKINLRILNELLKYDFLASDNTNNLPEGLERISIPGFKETCFEFLKRKENIQIFLPEFLEMPPKKIYNKVHFEFFLFNVTGKIEPPVEEQTVVLFDYNERDKVTGNYRGQRIYLWQSAIGI